MFFVKKSIVRIVCGVTALVLAFSVSVPSFATTIEEAEAKKKETENKLADTQQILSDLETLKSDADAYIVAMDQQLNAIMASIVDTQNKKAAKQAEIDATQQRLDAKKAEIAEQYATMKKRIQFMFENGNTFYMELFFESENISDMLNKAEYISEIETYDRNMLNKMEETQKEIEDEQSKLLVEKSELEQLEYKQQQEQASVETLIANKNAEIENYKSQIATTEQAIAQQQKELQEEQALVDEMRRIEAERAAAAAAGRKSSYTGTPAEGFIWPLSSHNITSDYGTRTDPIDGSTSYHNGVDIGAPSGSEIYAVADGQVAWSYYSSTAGNWIGIDHGGDIYSVYMHCSVSYVKEGDIVKQGDVIGLVGSTGRSTGPHLHLSIRAGGQYVNPHSYVG